MSTINKKKQFDDKFLKQELCGIDQNQNNNRPKRSYVKIITRQGEIMN